MTNRFPGALGTLSLLPDQRALAKANAAAAIDEATRCLDRGDVDEATWCRRVTDALAKAYLLDDDPRWQSGFDGDPELWRQARELVLDPVTGDGAFLDIGCATGHLMECLAAWARERGITLAMHGLELHHDLAAVARRRLPALTDHIHEGNALDWQPPQRFRYVRTGLEYVPGNRAPFLVERLMRDVVEPGGRLIVGPVNCEELDATVTAFTGAGFETPHVQGGTDRNGKTRHVVWVGEVGPPALPGRQELD